MESKILLFKDKPDYIKKNTNDEIMTNTPYRKCNFTIRIGR